MTQAISGTRGARSLNGPNAAPLEQEPGHTVQPGETLQQIARAHGLSLKSLLAANPQLHNPDVIYPGTRLHLPHPSDAPGHYTVRRGDTLAHIAHEHGLSLATLVAANPQLHHPDRIEIGERLRLPPTSATAGQRHAQGHAPAGAADLAHPAQAGLRAGAQIAAQPSLLQRLLDLLPWPTHSAAAPTNATPSARPSAAAATAASQAVAPATAFVAHGARDQRWLAVRGELVNAARDSGVDAGVVAMIANFESGFNTNARPIARDASRNRVRQFDGTMALSSAHGLGQFTDGTWQQMLREHGAAHGVANAGNLSRAQANALRTDTRLQAAMLAEHTRQNIETGRELGGRDDVANVYALHNLGAGDGADFLRALRSEPAARVDAVLPEAVISNNSSLYGNGSITVEAAYQRMGDAMRAGQTYAADARSAAEAH
ncbi:LysM domain-containing protein [Paucibacter sp. APW11]|uniref:LysM domain-containing protein n=1 Tax=Roseateles aquae TaxID=3077235 RepID=A0ABU3PEJ5_9BURK|nr:LysM domain-containing protein [Paucibacter sp. APW11]MDT9000959.1 LysM domain-containing protein [Paucibacter sp. APW11]